MLRKLGLKLGFLVIVVGSVIPVSALPKRLRPNVRSCCACRNGGSTAGSAETGITDHHNYQKPELHPSLRSINPLLAEQAYALLDGKRRRRVHRLAWIRCHSP